MTNLKKVALVIPAYNEEKMIASVVKGLQQAFKGKPYDYRIIVVDDGSKDTTASKAKTAGAYVIRHILNSGQGAATTTGLSYALQQGYDVAATLDGDGQHDPKDVLEGVNQLLSNNIDLLIGSRLLKNEGMPRAKIIGNQGLSLVTYLLFGIKVTDSQSGLRVFSKKALSELKWRTSGYEFCSEMLWRAKQINLNIDEYPIKTIYTDYSLAKGQNNWNAFNIVKSLLRRRLMELFSE